MSWCMTCENCRDRRQTADSCTAAFRQVDASCAHALDVRSRLCSRDLRGRGLLMTMLDQGQDEEGLLDDPVRPGDQILVLCKDGRRRMKTIAEIDEPDPLSHRLFNDTRTYKTDDGQPAAYGMDGVEWFEP